MKPSDLHIRVDRIPDAGLDLIGELPVEWLADALLDAYRAETPLSVRLEARRVNENVLVSGTVSATLGFDCSRTLQPARVTLDVPVGELFVPAGRHATNLGAGIDIDVLEDEDDEPWLIANGVVDAEQLVRELFVLAQDPYPLAPDAASDGDGDADPHLPAWTSDQVEADPRWAKLGALKLD